MHIIDEQNLWNKACDQAKSEYEKEFGSWKDADKYEKQDLVFSKYIQLKSERRD